jgi:hypothetical protein
MPTLSTSAFGGKADAPHLRDKPLEKTTFYTKVGDRICSIGNYKD